MFAPQPIVFRYDDAGLLGQAAAAAGQSQGGPQRSFMQPGQLFGGPAPGDPFHDLPPQANQLQQAGSLMMQQQPPGSSTSGNYFAMTSPITKSIAAAKALSRSSQVSDGDLSDDQNSQLDTLQNDPSVSPDEFNKVIGSVSQGSKAKAQKDQLAQDSQTKNSIIDAVKDRVSPDDLNVLSQYASDPRVSALQMHSVIQQSVQRQSQTAALKVQQDTKQQLISQAQTYVHPDELQQIQQMATDPKVTTEQFHQAIVASHQHVVQAAQQQQQQQLSEARTKASVLKSQIADLGKDPNLQVIQSLDDLRNAPPDVAKKFQQLQQSRNQLSDIQNQLTSTAHSQFQKTATDPKSGDKIGLRSDGKWIDVVTGQEVQ